MKKQTILLLLTLGFTSVIIAITSCKKNQTGEDPALVKTIVSNWAGIFTGTTVDGNVLLALYSDKSLSGSWTADDGSFTFNYSGEYTQADTVFTFSSSGTANYQTISSSFILTGNGILNSTKGHGIYNIDFINNEYFDDQSGDWKLNKSK